MLTASFHCHRQLLIRLQGNRHPSAVETLALTGFIQDLLLRLSYSRLCSLRLQFSHTLGSDRLEFVVLHFGQLRQEEKEKVCVLAPFQNAA